MSYRTLLSLILISAPVYAGNWNVPTEARNLQNPVAINAVTNRRARVLFDTHCQQCHGPLGAGDGSVQQVSYDLRGIVVKLTDGELYWKITHGVGKMPSFAGPLTDEERWLVINHLRNLAAPHNGFTHKSDG